MTTTRQEFTTEEEIAQSDELAPDGYELGLDVVFELLKNRRRRCILEYFADESVMTSVSDLSEHLGAVENEKPPDELTSTERKRAYVSLYQTHLPKLHTHGVIEYDEDRGTVTTGPAFDQVYSYLDESKPVQSARRTNALVLVAASLAFVALVEFALGLVASGAVAVTLAAIAVAYVSESVP